MPADLCYKNQRIEIIMFRRTLNIKSEIKLEVYVDDKGNTHQIAHMKHE